MCAPNTQGLQQSIQILAVRESFLWPRGFANSSNVITNHSIIFTEGLKLIVPASSIQNAASANEHERKPFALHFVVQAGSIDMRQSLFHASSSAVWSIMDTCDFETMLTGFAQKSRIV